MFKYTKSNRGFTLIELLVVIAIIGILSGIVLTSLNSARSKATDTKVKAQLASMRAQAEIYYDGNSQSYANVCTGTNGLGDLKSATPGAWCGSEAEAWVAGAPIGDSGDDHFCVDSTGYSGTTTLEAAPSTTGTYKCK